ncbi:hypothetical protein AN639_01235 [Candidatus Epulonipiscium fishelsonii]|uniref:Uncharacterized protein n=1 Tax=Candidatus Epulonipiscium fishelsonii TaxID=77094 RepID=A0ACC8X811_9FIRM|nr:hypothetical protein AN396_12005 [Epulopiscium sp. SCG-B11WGA-EpuloA1]ONI40732.1 hypothetical protein AN639_01235 [Epulopiscium sp. SCG-B05WGA-EpuloA1]
MKTYIIYAPINFDENNLTGGNKRFLELLKGISAKNKVILLCGHIDKIHLNKNIKSIPMDNKKLPYMPYEIGFFIKNIVKILQIKKSHYNYTITWSSNAAVTLILAGFKNIILLLRADLVEYIKADLLSINFKTKLYLYFKIFFEGISLIGSKKIILQSKYDKKALLKRHRFIKEQIEKKIFIQSNNINPSWVQNYKKTYEIKQNAPIKILFIGNFDSYRKGFKVLLEAVNDLQKEKYNIKLGLIGGGLYLEQYKQLYKNNKQIKFYGPIFPLDIDLVLNYDFIMVPSLAESYPNVIMEALYYNIAVYGSKIGGIPYILNNPSYLFKPVKKDIKEFIKAKISNTQYITDARNQNLIRKNLTFNWSEKIINIIEK